jgi:hypothetical protein
MAAKKITRRGVVPTVAAWATVGIMTVGFAGLSTSSGAATTLSTPHGVAPKGISELVAASCPTVTHCVAVGTATGSTRSKPIPGAASTVNGGASWSKGSLQGGPNEVADVSCATKKKCVGVGGSVGATPTVSTAGVVVTNNGGVSWTGRLLAGVDGMLGSVACPSTTRCVAVGESLSASDQESSLVFTSSDGGASWAPGTLPNGTDGLNDVSCPSTKFCLAVGTSYPTGGPTAVGVIDAIYSKDGGSSWTTTTSPGAGLVSAVSCASSRVCVVVASTTGPFGPPESLFTADGGATWSAATLPFGIGSLLNVTCPSSRECIEVGTFGSPVAEGAPPADIYSRDGGRSWSMGKLPGTKASWVYAVACSTLARCVAVGSSGGGDDPNATATTNYTNNGGKTWS